ncbi:MAG: arsenic transporter [Lachnospiraceae bacterium]|nr:arsenic transporter [Lachnospiraceae bacterium]
MITAVIIFVLMYAGMLIFSEKRVYFALAAAVAMVGVGVLPISKVLPSINWNVIMMISGTMGIVTLFIETGMPARMADLMLTKVSKASTAIILLAVFSGLVSAFIDNVATVLMVAPVGLAICKKIKINPIPVLISIAVSSNLQGAATLVGDTTSILLGDFAKMSFMDFFFWQGKPSIFWAVELGAAGTVVILWLLFRKNNQPVESKQLTEVKDYVPGIMLLMVVVCLIIASFFTIPYIDDIKNGLICLTLCVIDVARSCIKKKGKEPLKLVLKEMDYMTIFMLCGLFVVIAGITEAGVIELIADKFASLGGGNLFMLYTVLVFASVILSAFIDNIPYVAAMLPVVQFIAGRLGINPVVLYFGLLSGATLGGNITPFGASANVAGMGILRKEGYEVKNSDFFKIGIPFTLTAVFIGYLFIWFVWA